MNIVNQSHEILSPIAVQNVYQLIERAGRTAYKSEDKITADSAERFIRMIRNSGHESVLEHFNITVRFITDRGITHEIVRHRLASYTQESTRYCDYGGSGIQVIKPAMFEEGSKEYEEWLYAMRVCERSYTQLISDGVTPQWARSVLPNSLKTEIVVTANIREWRHILRLRTSKAAHPQIRALMTPLLLDLQRFLPVLFEDIESYDAPKTPNPGNYHIDSSMPD